MKVSPLTTPPEADSGSDIEPLDDRAMTVSVQVTTRPIFIIGSPRSGTTALAASLQRHTALWTSEESQILWDLFGSGRLSKNYQRRGASDHSWLVRRGVDRNTFLEFVGLGMNALFTSISGGKRWVDHTPIYTRLVAELADMFPGAQFVHILRDGRRVVNSMMHFLSIFDGDPKSVPWARDFRVAAHTWAEFVTTAIEFERQRPDRCITVRSEEAVARPAEEFERIYDFLGLEHESEPVTFFGSRKINSSFGDSSRQSVQPTSRPWTSWTAEQRAIFMEEAGEVFASCGFAWRDVAPPAAGGTRP